MTGKKITSQGSTADFVKAGVSAWSDTRDAVLPGRNWLTTVFQLLQWEQVKVTWKKQVQITFNRRFHIPTTLDIFALGVYRLSKLCSSYKRCTLKALSDRTQAKFVTFSAFSIIQESPRWNLHKWTFRCECLFSANRPGYINKGTTKCRHWMCRKQLIDEIRGNEMTSPLEEGRLRI